MTAIRPRRAPLWFVVLVVVACAAALRVLSPASPSSSDVGDPTAPITFAFWGWVVVLVEALWTGVEVAGRVTLAILQYSVTIAWRAITLLSKGALELAGYAWKGAKITWDLLGRTYEHVLKPAWRFFWRWVDRVEQWLQRTFGPVLSWLRRVRDWVLTFYESYIQPILNVIELSRRALRVLGSLGLEWARALDRRLAELEDRIQQPFLWLVAKVNEIINTVNSVVDGFGLFQKLPYIRTLARDIKDAANQFGWGLHRPITGDERDALQKAIAQRSLSVVARDMRQYMRDGTGPDAEWLNQTAAAVRVWFGGLP